jgi:HPt (histidine-containing phosphotransfer) domain-containing protein
VRRWTGGDEGSSGPATGPTAPAAAVVDVERMRMLDGLRREGRSLFERASANFLAQAPDQVADVRTAALAADSVALTDAAHRLKGSAANLGLPALGEAANALEELGLGGRDGDVDQLVAALETQLERALVALGELRSRGL